MRKVSTFLGIIVMILGMVGAAQGYMTTQNYTFNIGSPTWDNPYDDPTTTKFPYYVYSFTDDITAAHLISSTAVSTSTPLIYLFDSAHTPGFNATVPTTFTNWLAYAAGTQGLTYALTSGTGYYVVVTETGSRQNGNGTLTINPSAVPIPGAVWLLGSGIVGLIGLRTRIKR